MATNPATRSPATSGRWGIEDQEPPTPWRESGTPILNSLLEHVPSGDAQPWVAGLELALHGIGGIEDRSRRHYTVLGDGYYSNQIGGCRTLTANERSVRSRHEVVQIQTDPEVTRPASGQLPDPGGGIKAGPRAGRTMKPSRGASTSWWWTAMRK